MKPTYYERLEQEENTAEFSLHKVSCLMCDRDNFVEDPDHPGTCSGCGEELPPDD